MIKHFQKWILKKEELHNKKGSWHFQEREIFWCGIGENIGDEENGKGQVFSRPVLVIRKFNKSLFWGAPLTTKNKENPYYIRFSFQNRAQSAMITHLRLLDAKRLYGRMGRLDQSEFNKIKKAIKNCL